MSRGQIAADCHVVCVEYAIAFAGNESCDGTTPTDHSVAEGVAGSEAPRG